MKSDMFVCELDKRSAVPVGTGHEVLQVQRDLGQGKTNETPSWDQSEAN